MAVTQMLPPTEVAPLQEANRLKRRDAIDSVLGTMGAEGELPSTMTLTLMEEYVDGHLTMTELVDTILAMAKEKTLPVANINLSDDLHHTQRRRAIDSALGTTRAEGVSPGPEVIDLSERYVTGEITLQELGTAVRAMSGL